MMKFYFIRPLPLEFEVVVPIAGEIVVWDGFDDWLHVTNSDFLHNFDPISNKKLAGLFLKGYII